MLELADTTAKDKNVEENKRKKAKLLKKLKEQESLANANNAVSKLALCFIVYPCNCRNVQDDRHKVDLFVKFCSTL